MEDNRVFRAQPCKIGNRWPTFHGQSGKKGRRFT
jgi:hypothetical protein